jgi:hypothetical protein
MAVRFSALHIGRALSPRKIPGTHFWLRLRQPQGHSVAGSIRPIEKIEWSHQKSNPLPSSVWHSASTNYATAEYRQVYDEKKKHSVYEYLHTQQYLTNHQTWNFPSSASHKMTFYNETDNHPQQTQDSFAFLKNICKINIIWPNFQNIQPVHPKQIITTRWVSIRIQISSKSRTTHNKSAKRQVTIYFPLHYLQLVCSETSIIRAN